MKLPNILIKIAKELEKSGAKAIVVGGAVRDYLLNLPIKDYDIEVFNIDTLNSLETILSKFGSVNQVGKSFGVVKLKVDNLEIDFSLPRVEQKINKGHRGFKVELKPNIDFKQAAKRRDFTINSMGYDILEQKLLDPYNGKRDLLTKTLQIVNKNSFKEDPLRVYRAIQFAARFELKLSTKCKEACKEIVNAKALEELPKERIFEELKKLFLKSKKPSIGLELLKELNILNYYPELKALIGVIQDPSYHAEGDVWIHTLMVVDEMAKLESGNDSLDLKLFYAALCHDFGKPYTTKIIDGKIRALNHDQEGVEPTIKFLKRLTDQKRFIDEVANLVLHHLKVMQLYKNGAKNGAIRRLSLRVNLIELEKLARADYFGRISKDKKEKFEAGDWLLKKAKELNVLEKPPKSIIGGKDLINLGLTPSPKFKEILTKAYNAQLDGKFKTKEEGVKWVKEFLKGYSL